MAVLTVIIIILAIIDLLIGGENSTKKSTYVMEQMNEASLRFSDEQRLFDESVRENERFMQDMLHENVRLFNESIQEFNHTNNMF